MEDGGIGGIIFYIIAAVIGIVGSIASKKKKREEEAKSFPDFETQGADDSDVSDQRSYDPFAEMKRQMDEVLKGYPTQEESMSYEDEGEYEEPMAVAVSSEGASVMTEAMKAEGMLDRLNSDSATFKLRSEEALVSIDHPSLAREEAEEFEVRRAIVLSEILKPKYFSY